MRELSIATTLTSLVLIGLLIWAYWDEKKKS